MQNKESCSISKDCSACKFGYSTEPWQLTFCYNKNKPKENINNKLDYKDLREEIHKIFFNFLKRELECSKDNEFDFEWLEFRTDEILRLIKGQGGTT